MTENDDVDYLPPEPWYCGYMANYAMVVLWASVGIFVLACVGLLGLGLLATLRGADAPAVLSLGLVTAVVFGVPFLVSLLLVIFWCGTVLFLVDIGRNIGRIRYRRRW